MSVPTGAEHVFARTSRALPVVASARGCTLVDQAGRAWLDASGGAIVVGVGHGRREVAEAMATQAARVAYAHGTMFSSSALERWTAALAPLLPVDTARVYPVSSGSEAMETALKMARAYHLARGEDRSVVIGRAGSYHGNTRGALDVSGRESLRAPYEPWLGSARHVPAPYEYRCPFPERHPDGCGAAHAEALERTIREIGAERVAAFVAEPVAGAALGACVPPEDYWPRVAAVCRRYGVLVVADEVMTGFGRTGAWFASEHWGLRPDVLTAGKGAASGYWPLAFAAASGAVHDTITGAGAFVHGFTHSHHVVGAATGLAVLRILHEEDLVAASARQGDLLRQGLLDALGDHPHVGDVRGLGLLVGVELVADRDTRAPFARAERVTERVVAAAHARGVLPYSSTGCADGVDGDLLLLGPPFVITDAELARVVAGIAGAVGDVLGGP